ncbi:LAO/AO transport system kinase [Ardenticatena maritima]|uniref:GTPase n=1 Tax=Ardenticatena maritima TaxID=872965 RepID=A0A0M8K9H3_9CHLR|nr:methylmalonyl Co-A mutase-associated GTPase MeaB [Ardenticatena maritima]KPL87735.1 GTPase [Ardenticatena maritima]GAP63482.1 LAO/AO transport system kinase [Ardenticatena maritima]
MSTPPQEAVELVERLLAGDRRALARAITRVENGGAVGEAILAQLYPRTGQAHIVGVTGPPGAGKSTLVNALTKEFRARDKRVAIVAIDPTSPFSGGALLGDRIRMRDHTGDAGVFIRSMATRGSLGGLARATGDVVSVLDAAGFDIIFIETVGAGQVEVDIAREAHTTIVIEVPGLGDDVQSIKAGLLEIADIFVVNKADHPDAVRVMRTLRMMLDLGHPRSDWKIPILPTVATRGEGVAEVADAIEAHRRYLEESGEWQTRVRIRAENEFERILRRELVARLRRQLPPGEYERTLDEITRRGIDPYTAAHRLLEG